MVLLNQSMASLLHGLRFVITEPNKALADLGFKCRPELCDALPWFRAVQGGSYHCDHLCWGFLLDADCGIRSYIDEEVIVTRV